MNRLADEYRKLKENCPADILLYQVGTFYKIMHDDARKVSELLGLKLFVAGEASSPVSVCGFPKSGLDKYVGKLARLGFSVAICDQIKEEGRVIRREISEVVACSKTR